MFKASGTVENPERAAAAMIENLNRGPESIVQHNCPDRAGGISFCEQYGY